MLKPINRSSFNILHDALTLQSENSQKPAIIYVASDQTPITVTRKAFQTAVNQYAHALQMAGIAPHDLVIIAHTQSLESIYAFWGAMMLGAIPSMFPTLTEKLDPAIYMTNMAELVRLSAVKAILTTPDFAPQLQEVVGRACIVISSHWSENRGHYPAYDFQSAHPNPDDIAFLQHSSGTTGLQKGVALSHRGVLNQIANYSESIWLHEKDVVVSWLPLYLDMGLIAGFLLPLIQGIPLVLMSPFDWVRHPALLFKAIHQHQGTLCWLPNFAYNHCARRIRQRDLEDVSLASMRLFINCSEPVHHDSHQQFLARFGDLGVTPSMLGVSYAMAENTFAVTQTPPAQPARLDRIDPTSLEQIGYAKPVDDGVIKVSCGQPIRGTAVTIRDPQGQEVADRHVGEIYIHSDYMLTEYYGRSDLQPFYEGWYQTGDQGYRVDDDIFVIGRSKDLIINAGKNIYPQDLEAIVNDIAGVHAGRAVVFGVPDEREGTELIAVVAEVDTTNPDEQKVINKAIRQEIGRQSMVTVTFVKLVDDKWLIKTSSGKIARAANRDKWLAERRN